MWPLTDLATGQKKAGQDLKAQPKLHLWNGSPNVLGIPPAVWTPYLVLVRGDFEMFSYLSTHWLFLLVNKHLVPEYSPDPRSHEYHDWGDRLTLSSCVSCRYINSNLCTSDSISLLGVCFLFCKVRMVTSLQIIEWLWSSNEIMYAQMLSKSKKLTYKCIFSPVVVVHESSTGPTGFSDLQHAEDHRVPAVSTWASLAG